MADIDVLLNQTKGRLDPQAPKARVLIATSMGGFNHGAVTEKALAIALGLRDAEVDIFLCDGAPGCQLIKIGAEPPDQVIASDIRSRCPKCFDQGFKTFAPLGRPILRLGEFLTEDDRAEAARIAADVDFDKLKEFRLGDWAIGEHALAGALRYFARGDLSKEPDGDAISRQFLKASVQTARAIDRVFAVGRYDVAVFNHGIYTPQGVIGEVARSRGVRVVNWNPAYRNHCFVFSHGDSYHHTMITEPLSAWETIDLDDARRTQIEDYLEDRREARGDWIWFNKSAGQSTDEIRRALDLDERPVALALTSVVWDACLHYDSNAFENLKDWMLQTIEYFSRRADMQLVIRVHPAEVTGFVKSRDKMADAIEERFPTLPENIRVIAPEDTMSTYSLVDLANAVLIYSTKTGIEASAAGKRVIVAGEAWIRNKGFTQDAASPESYRTLLDALPFDKGLDETLKDRALRYAYHFFFRRMIELPFIATDDKGRFSIEVENLEALDPGCSPGLDVICDGILLNEPFIDDRRY